MTLPLYEAISQAGSQTDPAARKAGEEQLKQLREQPGFITGLLEIFSSREVPFEVRWLAAIQLKNSVDGLWRNQMLGEEKASVRSRLFECARAGDARLERQFALVVAKVAKHDFPKHWPELFDELHGQIRTAASAHDLQVPLWLLHQSLKLISTAKIGPARTKLNEIAAPMLVSLGETYSKLLNSGDLDVSYTCLKAMGTLLYNGPDGIYRQNEFLNLVSILQQMLPAYQQTSKHVLRIGKIYERLADRKPVVFCMLPGAIELMELYRNLIITGNAPDSKVLIQGAAIFRLMIELVTRDIGTLSPSMLPLKLRFKDQQDKQDLLASYELMKSYFYRDHGLISIIEAALTKYFLQSEQDLELWHDDPEEFVQEDLLATHEFNVTVCFQLLFFKILKAYPSLGNQVMAFVSKVFEDPSDILRLDAALQGLQYGSFVFHESMTTLQVFEQLLMLVDRNSSTKNYNIIRRRMCLLVSEWLGLDTSPEARALIYRVVVEMLFVPDPLNDLPVQLAGLHLLKCAVDDLEFEAEAFMPFADATFSKVYQLLNEEVSSLEIKRSILEVLSTLVEQTGMFLNDEHIQRILNILPPLWNEQTENQLIKTIIIQTLMHLVDSSREKSVVCHPFALEVLRVSIDTTSPLYSYLVEDALGLWQSLLTNADRPYPALLSLFDSLVNLLVYSTENLGEELTLLASYIHLEPTVVRAKILQLLSLFAQYLMDCTVEANILMLQAVELIAKMLPLHEWREPLQQSGLVPILDGYGGGASAGDIITEVRTVKVFGILSWMAMQDPVVVVQTFQFAQLCDGWVWSIKFHGDPHDRKLFTLGLTRCVQVRPEILRSQAPIFINTWTLVLDEVKEVNGDAAIYHLYPGETEQDLTPEQLRLRILTRHDPVHNIDMRQEINQTGALINWQMQ